MVQHFRRNGYKARIVNCFIIETPSRAVTSRTTTTTTTTIGDSERNLTQREKH